MVSGSTEEKTKTQEPKVQLIMFLSSFTTILSPPYESKFRKFIGVFNYSFTNFDRLFSALVG